MNFKVDDRVRVYATLIGVVAETKGTVLKIRDDGMLLVLFDGRVTGNWAHPKQCRKLRKKERRKIWMNVDPFVYCRNGYLQFIGPGGINGQVSNYPRNGWLEFVEVKKP